MKSLVRNNLAIFSITGLIISGLIIGAVSGKEQILIHEKTVHFSDEYLVNEQSHISFTITDDQYNSYNFVKIDYHNPNPSTSLWLYITSDNSYELFKKGHGITSAGIGSQLFGDGTIYRNTYEFKDFPGYNHLILYGMVTPSKSESDVTFSIILTDEIISQAPTTLPPTSSISTTTIPSSNIHQTSKISPTFTRITSWPTDTPSSPVNAGIGIFAFLVASFFLTLKH